MILISFLLYLAWIVSQFFSKSFRFWIIQPTNIFFQNALVALQSRQALAVITRSLSESCLTRKPKSFIWRLNHYLFRCLFWLLFSLISSDFLIRRAIERSLTSNTMKANEMFTKFESNRRQSTNQLADEKAET